jgi:metal-sulfur cluster biosynthetic enzyme
MMGGGELTFPVTGHANVTVSLVVNVHSTWGKGCELAQVYRQAAEEALETLHKVISGYQNIRIVGEPDVTAILIPKK